MGIGGADRQGQVKLRRRWGKLGKCGLRLRAASSTCEHESACQHFAYTPTNTSLLPRCCVRGTWQTTTFSAASQRLSSNIPPAHDYHTMSAPTAKPTGPLAPQYITGVYIPSVILIAGTAVFKLQWLPLALAVCAALGGYQFFGNRTSSPTPNNCTHEPL